MPANLQDEPLGNEPEAMFNAEHEPLFLPGPHLLNPAKVLPNLITSTATCVGLSSVYFKDDPAIAMSCIVLAGILDGLDGPAARALNTTSRFGAELDSISDVINFGVAPALLLYNTILHQWKFSGWIVSLLFTVAVSCRLARFNAGIDFNASKNLRSFFMGVPAPVAAACVMLPLMVKQAVKNANEDATGGRIEHLASLQSLYSPEFVAFWNLIIAYLSVSRLPTFSSKLVSRERFERYRSTIIPVVSILGVLAAWFAYHSIWGTVALFWSIYLCLLPISYMSFKLVLREDKRRARTRKRAESDQKRRAPRTSSPKRA